jgi:hypothetical protein
MLIKIGYDIALRFPISTPVIYLLRVHPSRRSDLVEPERFSSEPALPVHEYYDGFGNHRGRLYALAGTIRLSSEAISGTAERRMYTPPTRGNWISLKFLPLHWSSYCQADIARLTVSLWISLGGPFSGQDPDGNGSKRFAILSMGIFSSIISKLGAIVLH